MLRKTRRNLSKIGIRNLKLLHRKFGRIRLLVSVTIIVVFYFINAISLNLFQSRTTILSHSSLNPFTSNEEKIQVLLPPREREILLRQSFPVGDANGRRAVIVTVASHDVSHFVLNLRCFVRQTSKKDIVLFSLDSNMTSIAKREGIETIGWHPIKPNCKFSSVEQKLSNDSNPHLYGSQAFSSITLSKLDIVRQILSTGLDVILSDVDIVWCKDVPGQFKQLLNKHPAIDIFMQSDTRHDGIIGPLNTGFYYVKSSPNVMKLFDGLIKESNHRHSLSGDDQGLFWGYACSRGRNRKKGYGVTNMNEGKNGSHPLFLCQWNDGSVKIMFLPVSEYPNGSSDPEGRVYKEVPEGYYREVCKRKQISIWHVNYCKGDVKERRLKEQNVWISRNNGTCEII